MTQEEKQLVLKDLCARLPYGIVVQQSPKYVKGDVGYETAYDSEKKPKDFNIIGIEGDNCLITDKSIVKNTYSKGKISEPVTISIYSPWTKQMARPYLRSMSSMTDRENEELKYVIELGLQALEGEEGHNTVSAAPAAFEVDFYNKYHFDYRGLIEKGLAIEAPADIYKTD